MTDVKQTARDAAYITIGLGVLGFQRLQVLRNDLTKAVQADGAKLEGLMKERADDVRSQVDDLRSQVDGLRTTLEGQLGDVRGTFEAQLGEVREQVVHTVELIEGAL